MKFSALATVAFLAASSLGMPELSSRAPGQIIVTNNMNRVIRLDNGATENLLLHQGQTLALAASEPSVGLIVREEHAEHGQAEVSFPTADKGTFGFTIKSVEGGGFPGAIEVIPLSPRPSPRCHPLVWYPGQGDTQQAICQDRTPLRVFLREAHHPAA